MVELEPLVLRFRGNRTFRERQPGPQTGTGSVLSVIAVPNLIPVFSGVQREKALLPLWCGLHFVMTCDGLNFGEEPPGFRFKN